MIGRWYRNLEKRINEAPEIGVVAIYCAAAAFVCLIGACAVFYVYFLS
jgi:hypothetical protein